MVDLAAMPLLLIDVDGPLNAFGGPYGGVEAPDGYQLHRLHNLSWTDEHGRAWMKGGQRLWLNPAHGPMLLTLADRVELAWCTAWRENANRFIGPMIGLPELPVVPLPEGWVALTDHIWKLPGVEEYAGDRPLAWLDDEFKYADFQWAEKRTAAGSPTLLVHINAAWGIEQKDVDAVAEWAASIESGRNAA